jgi:hypothetical protein
VETAIERIVVFFPAFSAHLEMAHRGVGTVIRQRFNDTEARTTVRAVRERIQVAPIPRIKHFAETILADRDVRQDKRSFGPTRFAGSDFESGVTGRIEPGRFQALDETAGRFLAFNPQDEPLHLLTASLKLDTNTLR